jgi:uncharacterized delta-60 repeat protein
MSLKKFSVGTLQSKKVSTYKFSSNRLSLRRFPFPSAPVTPTAVYVEDVFSTFLYTGNSGSTQSIPNNIRLGDGATSAGWIATLSSSNLEFSVYGEDVAIDSSGNVYVCGTQYGTGYNFQIAKYNSTGTLLWQKTMSTVYYASSITVDSNDNVYVAGTVIIGTDEAYIIKLDSSGNIQWQRTLGGANSQQAQSVKVDSSGNVYIGGTAQNASSGYDLFIAKYDASGTLQWQRLLGLFGTSFNFGYDLALDSSGNPHICGIETVSTRYRMFVAKYDTSGVFQWQRRLTGSDTDDRGQGVAVDSAGNVYMCGFSNSGGSPGSFNSILAKYNSSGVLQWQRSLGLGYPTQDYGYSVTVDSNDDVFISGSTNGFDTDKFLIAKYNSSGVLQWQRILGRNESISGIGAAYGYSIKVDNRSSMYICGYIQDPNGKQRMLIAKLPADGTGIGGYEVGGYTYRYEESTLTNSASTFSNTAGVLNNTAASLSNTSNTFTTSTSNLTSSLATVSTGTGSGGMVWIKARSGVTNHAIYDTARGATLDLASNLTDGQTTQTTGLTSFNFNGFTIGSLSKLNGGSALYASWTFRKQAKFFDVVTYTGNGLDNRQIPHNLGATPGCFMIKRTDTAGSWTVYHRSIGSSNYLTLSSTGASAPGSYFNDTDPTSTAFTVSSGPLVNSSGGTYVAYLFAHDAGGFGNLGTDNIISCGSFTTDGSENSTTVLGYEPQWLLLKAFDGATAASQSWQIFDSVRGLTVNATDDSALQPNNTNTETQLNRIGITSTGFTTNAFGTNTSFIYIAIRRGPMRTPTDASKVFQPVVYTGTNVDNRLVPTGILTDMIMARQRNSTSIGFVVGDRLRSNEYLRTDNDSAGVTDADSLMTPTVGYGNSFSAMNGFGVGNDATSQLNISTVASNQVVEAFARAPGFFDIVTYTGTGVARTVNHNLGAVPKMMWIKGLNAAADSWIVYSSALGSDVYVGLQSSVEPTTSTTALNSTAPTASVFSVGSNGETNGNGDSFVAYLFGEIPGISKVSYYLGKGAGTVNQIDCGFTTGARFLLVKSLLGVASWYVWDTARGIVAGNDPYILADLTNAETTNQDYVDSYAAGFELSTTAPEQLNGSYADNWDGQTIAGTSNFLDVMYENGYWVAAVTTNIYYSVSGYGWTLVSSISAGAVYGLAFGNGLYVAVGGSGRISTSSNLTSWTARTSGTTSALNGAAYAFGKYWACGASGTVVSSTDGVTWSTVSIGTANTLNRVRFLNGNLIFVGNSGTIVTTADGTTFTVQTSGTVNAINDVTYGNGLYVIVTNNGTIHTSPTLVTWTSRNPGNLAGNDINGVVWTGSRFVAVATLGETGYSADGITWPNGAAAGSANIPCVAYGNDMIIAGNSDGTVYASNPKFIFIAIA